MEKVDVGIVVTEVIQRRIVKLLKSVTSVVNLDICRRNVDQLKKNVTDVDVQVTVWPIVE